ncbi:hypothetical protein MtrunA17_Chr7g0256511 [Medicago truncatula]|uniref:Uncharacterized protein n=1 Tax=Medicago truncatula TaxID=3880 RepID=A0A396H5H4_MEDTR|nr:hypothetical protein MtrunA17_Chr7g0256511 [Medicago truncatula]
MHPHERIRVGSVDKWNMRDLIYVNTYKLIFKDYFVPQRLLIVN